MTETRFETVACNLCGSEEHSPLHVIKGYTIVRCNECRLVFINPRPVASELATIYDDGAYYGGGSDYDDLHVGYSNYLALTNHLRFVVGELLRPLKDVTPGVALDVGCSMGVVLDQLRQRGWTPYGVDVSSYATEYARHEFGLNVFTGTLDDVDLPPDSVDLATMLLTVEHLPDPKGVLRQVHRLLKPGGVLIVGTHDIEGLWPRIVGARWRHFSMPEHVYYFSRRTLTRMLADVGLETFRATETATLAGVVDADETNEGFYAPVRLLHKTRLLGPAAPLLRAMHKVARRFDWSDGITTYAQKV